MLQFNSSENVVKAAYLINSGRTLSLKPIFIEAPPYEFFFHVTSPKVVINPQNLAL